MRQLDLSPLYRSTIGFDRLLNLVDQASGFEAVPSYPPYNIERRAEDAYRITVAGFSDKDLSVETKENSVIIRGSKEARTEAETSQREVLYIAARAFERSNLPTTFL
jgi:molecular chaperone IbpA